MKAPKMTHIMDKFFIHIGFNREELTASNSRGWIYIGMIFLIGLSTAFFIMSVFS